MPRFLRTPRRSDHDLAAAYALDALDDDERARFEAHLASCGRCTAEVAELSAPVVQLALAVQTAPPPSLRTNVLAAIANVPQERADEAGAAETTPGAIQPSLEPKRRAWQRLAESPNAAPAEPTPAAPRPAPQRARRTTTILAAACLALAAIVAGLSWSTLHLRHQVDSAAAREQSLARVLRADDVRAIHVRPTAGAVTAYYSPTLGQTAVIAQDLAPLPADRVYELWYLDGPGLAARPAGISRFDASQNSVILASGTAGHATSLAITVEPSGGSPQPTTAPIATVPLT